MQIPAGHLSRVTRRPLPLAIAAVAIAFDDYAIAAQ
jgi:hypothetical protein